MDKATVSYNEPAVAPAASRLAMVTGAAALVLLAALHVLSPEIDPSWRMVSEYAAGEYAWVLSLLFLCWSATTLALFFALRPHVRTVGGKIGLGLLIISALGSGMAAFFDFAHPLHGPATLLGVPTLPVAALLLTAGLRRSRGTSTPGLWLLAHLTWISLALMVAILFIGLSQTGGQFGPGVWIGWPNRLVVVAYIGWMLAASRHTLKVSGNL